MEAPEYERMYAVEERHWWYRGMRAIDFGLLDDWLAPTAAGHRPRLLDAGCGTGANLLALAQRGEALGIDLAEPAIRLSDRRGATVVRGSLEALPFADGSFDCVTSFDVLYHRAVRDDQRAVAELVRVLRPGGLLCVRVPALEMLRRGHDRRVHTRHRYERGELVRLLEGAGLQPLRATYCDTLLLPLVAARRGLDQLFGPSGSDLVSPPRPLAALLQACLEAEARFLHTRDLPLGASLIALARRPAAPA
jgi:SAM-dependent methyltransferase